MAIDSSDNVYVTDRHNYRVQVFDKDGNYLNKFGSNRGSRSGFYFRDPLGIAIDSADNVYVVDISRHWVKKFKQTRATISDPLAWKYELTWGTWGSTSGTFDNPWGIAIDGTDQVYVADMANHWVQVFDANGRFKSNLGVRRKAGHSKGKFKYPTGVAIKKGVGACSGDTIYVSDDKRISKYLDASAVNATLSGSSTPEKLAKARIAYLRGDRSNEGTKGYKFRERKSVLGDIIHSTAIYVGAPDLKWPDDKTTVFGGGAKYSKFGVANKGRKPVVYVGANDGMLHGFDANTGREVLAYMPGNLYSIDAGAGYHDLTDPEYKHRYYVDATPVISDVVIKTPSSKRSWRTVLVGSEGAGGRGLFALDITDPTQFSEARAAELVLWEFNDTHDEHLGFTMSTPTITALPNGRWAAIFGNGYQDTSADSTAGQASLFIVYLDGGTGGKWVKGKDYLRIDTGVGSISNRNGLSTPNVVDTDNDSIADRVYAGDVQGNLWVFDLSDIDQTKWRVAFKGKPLFNGSAKQPITAKPEVIRHPSIKLSIGNKPNVMVYFGTGQYMVAGDNTNMDVQSFYAVLDRGDGDRKPKHLLKQAFVGGTTAGGRATDPTIWKDTGKTYKGVGSGDRYGWYLELPKGERVVTAARHRTGLIHFNTVTPSDVRPCSAGGTGWMMMLRADSGGPPGGPAFDFDNDNKLTGVGDTVKVTTSSGKKVKVGYAGKKYAADKGLPTGVSIISERRYTPGSGTDEASKVSSSLLTATSENRGRISWMQLQPRSVSSPAPGPTTKLNVAPSTSTVAPSR